MPFELNNELNKMTEQLAIEIIRDCNLLRGGEFSDDVLVIVVTKKWMFAQYIRNPSERVKLAAVKRRWLTIRNKNFGEPSLEMIRAAEQQAKYQGDLIDFNRWLIKWNKTHKKADIFTCVPFLE